jgi:tetratricopeptide (TPR) repeat protein
MAARKRTGRSGRRDRAGTGRGERSGPSTPRADPDPAAPDADAEPLFTITPLKNPTVWIAIGLIAATCFVYAPVRDHGFVGLDDAGYIRDNAQVTAGLTRSSIAWAFTTGFAANWHPLTWLSHMLDVELFGVRPGAHHLVNLMFHVANTLLLFAVWKRMTGETAASAWVAALFAVHPLHVESVAWLAERKDVLSTLLWLLTMWTYVAYVARPAVSRYLWVMLAFALGLMAKPMLVTLPIVLLLLDRWPLARTAPLSRLLWEKAPLAALAIASSIVTLIVQRQGGAVSTLGVLPVSVRVTNALVSYLRYIGQMFWPDDLAVFYPYARSQPLWPGVAALIVLVAASVLAVRVRRQRPYVTVGWFWYVVTLLPVIGFLQVGTQAHADRYTYVPLIGLFVLIAWLTLDLLARWPMRRLAAVAALAVVTVCGMTAHAQVKHWRDAETLWQHALAAVPDNYRAHNALGTMLGDQGKTQEALAHFREVVRVEPNYPEGHHNLGLALASLGRLDEAIGHYRDALRLKPDMAEAHNNLGLALARQGKTTEAIAAYQDALRANPNLVEAHTNLGLAYTARGRMAEAAAQYAEALRLNPNAAEAQRKLGVALLNQGRVDEALARYREALRMQPAFAEARNDLGFALMAKGDMDGAKIESAEAIRLRPDYAQAHNNLGFALAGEGRIGEAMPHFAEAVRLAPDFELAHSHYGLALAGVGRYDEAVREFNEVLRLSPGNAAARRALDAIAKRRGRR